MSKKADKKKVVLLIKPLIIILLGTALAISIIQMNMESESGFAGLGIIQCGIVICLEIKLVIQEGKKIVRILKV